MGSRNEVSAGGVVYRREEDAIEIALAARRTRRGDLAWGLAKGAIEPGETEEQAAVREVLEETGLEVDLESDLGDIRSARVEGNLLNGGNFTVYAGAEAGRTATGITISGNRFGRGSVYGPGDVAATTGVTWTGNVWHHSGLGIPKP